MGLAADLLAIGEQVAPPEEQWGDPELPVAQLCPRLRTTYSPRVSWGDWRGFGEAKQPSMPAWARVWDPGDSADQLGLSLAPNPNRPPRYGLAGLTGAGRRQVWRSLALLEERRDLLSFWTISLPGEALSQLEELDSVSLFVDRVRKELAVLLKRRGLVPLAIGVCELQPKRSKAEGRPCPHWHIVFMGRHPGTSQWILSTRDLDRIIEKALATAGVEVANISQAGQVVPVRKSVRAYLSRYLTKKQVDPSPWIGGSHEALLPRQWWFWTRPLRQWVLKHVLPLSFDFLAWVHLYRQELQSRELIRVRILDLPDPRAPMTFEVNWLSCEALAQLVAMWQLDRWDDGWFAAARVNSWQASACRS